jgi:hypothetical protein
LHCKWTVKNIPDFGREKQTDDGYTSFSERPNRKPPIRKRFDDYNTDFIFSSELKIERNIFENAASFLARRQRRSYGRFCGMANADSIQVDY